MFTLSQRALLDGVATSGPISRAALVGVTGLSKAAVSGLSRTLIERRLLLEDGPSGEPDGPGRPSILLSLNPMAAYFVGVYAAGDPLRLVLTDLRGGVVARARARLGDTPEALAAAIHRVLPRLLRGAGVARARVRGIGLALTGLVDHRRGICLHSTLLGWRDAPVAALVYAATGLPTYLENDANAVAMSEKLFGAAREARDFSVVVLGDGIGCAHYVGGVLYRGHAGGAGEIAHWTVEPNGRRCRCGRLGCLDAVASRSAILAAAREQRIPASAPRELERLAAQGHAAAAGILERAGRALGTAIAGIVQSNDPERVLVIDVDGSPEGQLHRAILDAVRANVLPRSASTTAIRFIRVDHTIWTRGAASIAAHRFLAG